MARERFKLTKTSTDAFDEIAKGVGGSYQRIVRLLEEEVLSEEEFDFWSEATYVLVDTLKKLDELAKRADGPSS